MARLLELNNCDMIYVNCSGSANLKIYKPKNLEYCRQLTHHAVCSHNIELRTHLASAIAACCWWKNNCHMFGQLGICAAIVDYIRTDVEEAKATAAEALYALSFDPINCIVLHQNGAVPYLLESVESGNKSLQEAAAGCLSNIRQLALEADKIKYGVRQRYKINDSTDDLVGVGSSGSLTSDTIAKLCAEALKRKNN